MEGVPTPLLQPAPADMTVLQLAVGEMEAGRVLMGQGAGFKELAGGELSYSIGSANGARSSPAIVAGLGDERFS